jgi:hypothetical protein
MYGISVRRNVIEIDYFEMEVNFKIYLRESDFDNLIGLN